MAMLKTTNASFRLEVADRQSAVFHISFQPRHFRYPKAYLGTVRWSIPDGTYINAMASHNGATWTPWPCVFCNSKFFATTSLQHYYSQLTLFMRSLQRTETIASTMMWLASASQQMLTISMRNATISVGGCNFTLVLHCRDSISAVEIMEGKPCDSSSNWHAFQLSAPGPTTAMRGVLQPIATVLTTGGSMMRIYVQTCP